MFVLLFLGGLVGFIVSLILIIIKAIKKQPKKKAIISLVVSLILFVVGIIITPPPSDSTTTPTVTETPTPTPTPAPTPELSEKDVLRQELKDKYSIGKPEKFVRGDKTDNWRIVKVANGTPPSDYAVEYAKAYMDEGDIHYIVNFSLNTTTMIRVILDTVEAKTTEYVSKEEHDATVIGQGMLYTDKFYNLETGDEITVETNQDAGTVDADDLISAVREAIDGAIGVDEKIVDVSFDGSNLSIAVDLGSPDAKIPAKYIAISRISSITDNILKLGDKYYNTWETITIDFGNEGKAVLDKSLVTDQGFGKFFNINDDILK